MLSHGLGMSSVATLGGHWLIAHGKAGSQIGGLGNSDKVHGSSSPSKCVRGAYCCTMLYAVRKDLGGSLRTYQNYDSSQMGTTPKRGPKNHFEKLHNCALQATPLKASELSKMIVCRGYHMCQSKFMYFFQIWALQCPSEEKSNCSMSSAGAFQTTLQNAT